MKLVTKTLLTLAALIAARSVTAGFTYNKLLLYPRWRRGVVVNALVVINEVTLRRVRLILGWVTVCGRVNHLGL